MRIKTITCHDVYNVGASLQAYALQEYLQQQGHDVEIIDYKPDYLSKRYNFFAVNNPRFEKPFLVRVIYLISKFPERLLEYPEKKNFDKFRKDYLKLTKRYNSLEELKRNPPLADLYIAGSDQIWNTMFQNGKDGAFYLDFVPEGSIKASYAASFATENIAEGYEEKVKEWIQKLDKVSVRENSSLKVLEEMEIGGCSVLDPVFLLEKKHWESMLNIERCSKGIFVYDFDNSELVKEISCYAKRKRKIPITTFFKVSYADECLMAPGPLEFITTIYNSKLVISNSFHGTVFALIFHKDFYVINRNEKINVRMKDLLKMVGLEDRLINKASDIEKLKSIDWKSVDLILEKEKEKSKKYLMQLTAIKKRKKNE